MSVTLGSILKLQWLFALCVVVVGFSVSRSARAADDLFAGSSDNPLFVGRSISGESLGASLGVSAAEARRPFVNAGGAVLTRESADAFRQWHVWLAAAPAELLDDERHRASEGPEIQGVSDTEIKMGMASAFSGAAKESGENLKIGVDTAFAQVNATGGIFGRKLKLITRDDGYEPARTVEAMRTLDEQDKVFGFIGNFGTATAMVAAPYALDHKMLFFGAFTGSTVLRRDPPDRYVFNYRPGYADETEAVVSYLVTIRHIAPAQIAVFAQDDGFGEAGLDGVKKGLRHLRGEGAPEVLVLRYKRNTIDIDQALHQFAQKRKVIRAVVMVATYRAAARFIEKTREISPFLIYTDVSGVGSTSLADELILLGPKYASGVVVTQVVPAVDSYASAILDYKRALATYAPGSKPDYVSLEGFVDAKLLIAGLKAAGRQLDTEKLVDALETISALDLGIGTTMHFGASNHQASSKVWGTMLNAQGKFEPLDLN